MAVAEDGRDDNRAAAPSSAGCRCRRPPWAIHNDASSLASLALLVRLSLYKHALLSGFVHGTDNVNVCPSRSWGLATGLLRRGADERGDGYGSSRCSLALSAAGELGPGFHHRHHPPSSSGL